VVVEVLDGLKSDGYCNWRRGNGLMSKPTVGPRTVPENTIFDELF
jgi:hypothetical protein